MYILLPCPFNSCFQTNVAQPSSTSPRCRSSAELDHPYNKYLCWPPYSNLANPVIYGVFIKKINILLHKWVP